LTDRRPEGTTIGAREAEATMDIYHVWCDLKPGVRDTHFLDSVTRCMTRLRAEGLIETWRLMRRKLGLGPKELGEWHLMIEVRDLRQLEDAFQRMAARGDPDEGLHHNMNSLVANTTFALFRDFPDPVRLRGQERF
jgi:hypothetical protein